MKAKINILILSLIIIISCSKKITSTTNTVNAEIPKDTKYLVENITRQGDAYIINLSRHDSVFRLLTNNDLILSYWVTKNRTKTDKKIEVGKEYNLKLKPYNDVIPNCYENTYASDVVYMISYYNTPIDLRDQCEIVYVTNDLDGLFLLE